jgi:hypothetical protein
VKRNSPTQGEVPDLIAELEGAVRGEVRFDRGSRALYASDHSIYRQVPIGVVIPRDESDVEAMVAACRARSTWPKLSGWPWITAKRVFGLRGASPPIRPGLRPGRSPRALWPVGASWPL